MRKFSLLATTAVAVAALSTATAAQGRGAGKTPTAKAQNVSTSAPKAGGPSTHGSSGSNAGSTGHSATTKTSGPAHGESHGTSKKPTTTTASTSSGTSSGTSTGTTASTSTTTTPPPTFEPNAISTKISKNPSQLAKAKAMLPTGMTIEEASTGFRNQGQFIAALNASRNQGLDFVQLKDAMTVDGLSLGQAAKQVRTTPAPAPVIDAPAAK